ncbi:HET domain-containing protein [Microdochium nivale]|nr:HET domain-containing protein [Microdochium nivale]
MICDVCKNGLEGMWDPARTERVASLNDFGDKRDQYMGQPLDNLEYVFGHHKTETSFKAAVEDGCAVCCLYTELAGNLADVSHLSSRGIDYFSVFYVLVYKMYGSTVRQLQMICHFGQPQTSISIGFLPYDKPRYYETVREPMPAALGRSTGDLGTRQTMQNWMRVCFEAHTHCQKRRVVQAQNGYRPTRLLELSPHGTCRLVDGTDCPAVLRYVALSYCWGSQPVEGLLRLLRTTSQLLSEDRAVDTLPKTFREAAQIAQWFGVNYLWIDRLCIYQDSAEDWQREAGTMKDVYQNADFSIAALGGKDSDGGCFFDRDPSKSVITTVHTKLAEAHPPTAFLCEHDYGAHDYTSLQEEPLTSRSWVVQERLLASRTLYFGSRQVYWECRESVHAEIYPMKNIFYIPNYKNSHPWKPLIGSISQSHSFDHFEQLFQSWNYLVTYYSEKRLTMPADKLIAISGLAKDMKATLSTVKPRGTHRYLAGLWEENFLQTLDWFVKEPASRVSKYRAPSWSWACVDGSIHMSSQTRKRDTKIISNLEATDMVYKNNDETGEVVSGAITLQGPCSKVRTVCSDDLDQQHQRKIVGLHGCYRRPLGGMEKAWGTAIFDTVDDVTEDMLVIWLSYCSGLGAAVSGLIIAPLGDGTFRRLGCASTSTMCGGDYRNFADGQSNAIVDIV